MSEVYEPPMSDLETAIAQAYEQGIKAAREAVANARMHDVRDGLVAVAAIDALSEEGRNTG